MCRGMCARYGSTTVRTTLHRGVGIGSRNELLYGWSMTESADTNGLRTLTMSSANPTNVLTSIQYAGARGPAELQLHLSGVGDGDAGVQRVQRGQQHLHQLRADRAAVHERELCQLHHGVSAGAAARDADSVLMYLRLQDQLRRGGVDRDQRTAVWKLTWRV